MKNGWVEKQRQGHVEATLKTEFRLLSSPETRQLSGLDCYRNTGLKRLSQLTQESSIYLAIAKDIFWSNLFLLSQQPLSAGDKLEMLLQLPQYRIPLGLLAEVRRVNTTLEMGRNLYHGALQVMAFHKNDVDRLSRSLVPH